MKKVFLLVCILPMVFSFLGCSMFGREYMMKRDEMSIVPDLNSLPEKSTVIAMSLDPVLDLSEGGEGRISWPALLLGDNFEARLLALNLTIWSDQGQKILAIIYPGPLTELIGRYPAVISHGGTTMYNHRGQPKELKSINSKVNLQDFKEFLTPISLDSKWVMEIEKGSENFLGLLEIYKEYRIRELNSARQYIYNKYGTVLTEIEMEKLRKEDSIVRSFAEWLGKDWKVFVTFPFMSIGGTALVAGIVKVFTLPSIWGDKLKKPGYMEYIPNAGDTAGMIVRGMREYGHIFAEQSKIQPKRVISSGEQTPLPENLKFELKRKTGMDFSTYEEYNLFVITGKK